MYRGLYEDIQEVVGIQDCNNTHRSHIPTEISKAMEMYMTWQEWRVGRKGWACNLGEHLNLRQRQEWSQQNGLRNTGQRKQNYQHINIKGLLEKTKTKKHHVGSTLGGRGHRIWHREAIVNFHKSSLSRASECEVWIKCSKKWKGGEEVLAVFFFKWSEGQMPSWIENNG